MNATENIVFQEVHGDADHGDIGQNGQAEQEDKEINEEGGGVSKDNFT